MRMSGAVLGAALLVACANPPSLPPSAARPAPRPARGPTVEATVLTIRASSHPPTRALLHRIVVSGSQVRMTDELDRWRLFDLDAKTVTWVDDIAKTTRTVPLDDLVQRRRRQLAQPVPATIRAVSIRRTDEIGTIAGVEAEKWVMELGGYTRELWISREPLVTPDFLRMWIASDPIDEPWAGVMRHVHRTLMSLEGFPVSDRSVIQWEGGETLAQRRLVGIETKRVPAALFRVPGDYTDVTPPALRSRDGRQSSSSRRRGRSARAAE